MRATISDLHAAYHLLLSREIDDNGLRSYSELIERGMTLEMLRNSLMSSVEFHSKQNASIQRIEILEGTYVSVDSSEPEFGSVIAKSKTWEPHIIEIIVGSLVPGDTYVDVGGNVGVMAFHAARCVGPEGKVIAFEPNRYNAERFIEGLLANDFANVILHQLALSDHRKIVSMNGGSNSFVGQANNHRLVQAIEGDAILSGEKKINFIKFDIEGFEPFAMRVSLKRCASISRRFCASSIRDAYNLMQI